MYYFINFINFTKYIWKKVLFFTMPHTQADPFTQTGGLWGLPHEKVRNACQKI